MCLAIAEQGCYVLSRIGIHCPEIYYADNNATYLSASVSTVGNLSLRYNSKGPSKRPLYSNFSMYQEYYVCSLYWYYKVSCWARILLTFWVVIFLIEKTTLRRSFTCTLAWSLDDPGVTKLGNDRCNYLSANLRASIAKSISSKPIHTFLHRGIVMR